MPDPIDAAQALEEMARQEALRRALAPAPHHHHALAGNGICADCEEPIPPARLAVLPLAERCLPCQRQAERRR